MAEALTQLNLPGPFTRFVGRQADLAVLDDLLSRRAQVTILGPPGTGKTRLAIEYALAHRGAYAPAYARGRGPAGRERASPWGDGIWFCDLTNVRDLDGICAAFAQTLDLSLAASGPRAVEQVGAALASRGDALVILDSFEQVIAHAATTISVWHHMAPAARLLVTSRERLRLVGEVLFDLPPLSLPGEGETTPEAISRAEAVQLFLERAGEVRPHYRLTEKDAPAVAALVRELDGLPLAIELAAARMRVLSPAHLLKNLDRRFELLAAGRGGKPRWAGLEAAIESSWELLPPSEQIALAECAVFRGGFSLEAAEHVLDLSGDAEPAFALDVVQSLCDKSLLYYYEPGGAAHEPRYSLYLSIREYAARKLKELGRDEAAKARHARYYLEAGAAWVEQTYHPRGSVAQRRLSLETENLLVVHRRALRARPQTAEGAGQALAAVLVLNRVLGVQGPFGRYLSLLDAALAAGAQAGADPRLRADTLNARGSIRKSVGSLQESLADYEEARALAEVSGDRSLLGRAHTGTANVLCLLGRFTEARENFARALSLFHEAGDRREEGVVYSNLGFLEQARGNLLEAREHYERALHIHREIGYRGAEGIHLNNLVSVEMEHGQLDVARRRLDLALAILEEVGDRQNKAVGLANLALIEQEQGHLPKARVLFEQALRLFRETGDRRFEGPIVGELGICYHEEGDRAAARACYEQALPILRAMSNRAYEGLFTAYVGVVEAQEGRIAEARAALSDAAAHVAGPGVWGLEVAVALCGGHVDVAEARAAEAKGDVARARSHAAAARRLLNAIPAAPNAQTSLAEVSADVRAAARLLRLALADMLAEPDPAEALAPSATEALVVAESGRWFQPPGGARISLIKRRTLRRLLMLLATHRVDAPGVALPLGALFEAGWPGERVSPELAANRVYTALWMLKKLGLRAILVSRDDGYLLDPAPPFALSQDAP